MAAQSIFSKRNNVPPFASQGEDIVQLARPLVDPDCSSQVHGCQRVEPHQEGQRLHHMCPGLYQYDSCTISLTESIVISESRNPSLKRMDGLTFDILMCLNGGGGSFPLYLSFLWFPVLSTTNV